MFLVSPSVKRESLLKKDGKSFIPVSAILCELVSHASRTEWCNMRRYSAFAACVCDVVCVYVNVVACLENK